MGVQRVLEGRSNLLREPLLDLHSAGKELRDAHELGEAHNLAPGKVGDVGAAVEGDKMVLTHAEQLLPDDDVPRKKPWGGAAVRVWGWCRIVGTRVQKTVNGMPPCCVGVWGGARQRGQSAGNMTRREAGRE